MLTLTLLTVLAPLAATQADVPGTVPADAATPEADAAPATAPKRRSRGVCGNQYWPRKTPVAAPDAADPAAAPTSSSVTTTPSTAAVTPAIDEVVTEAAGPSWSFVCARAPLPRKAPVAGPDAADPAAAPTSSSVTTTPSTAAVTPAIDEVVTEAAGPSWSYVQIAAGTTTLDFLGTDFDLDTVDVRAGARISDALYLHATYQENDFVLGGESTGLRIGVGMRTPVSSTVDLFAQGSYVSVEAAAISASTDGWGADAGIRAMVAPRLELGASVQYVDDGTVDSTAYEGHAYFNVVGGLALTAEYVTDPDADQTTTLFGLRYSF